MASIELQTINGELAPQVTFGDSFPLGHEIAAAEPATRPSRKEGGYLNYQANNLRLAMRNLWESDDEDVKLQVASINGRFEQETKGLHDARKPYIRGTEIVEWLANADTRDIRQFSVWNVGRNHEQQAALNAVTPMLKDNAVFRFDRLIEHDFFPLVARKLLRTTIDQVAHITAIDSFEAGGMHANGYYDSIDSRIAFPNLFDDRKAFKQISRLFYEVNVHEHVHATGFITNRGFFRGISTPLMPNRFLSFIEEPFAAHAAMSALSVDPHKWSTFMPDKHPPTASKGERKILGLFMEYGPHEIVSEHVAAAYFAPKSDRRNYRRDLERKLRANATAFFPELGDDALFILAARHEDVKYADRPHLLNAWLLKMYAELGVSFTFETIDNDDASQQQPIEMAS